jgi:hypothetical protein
MNLSRSALLALACGLSAGLGSAPAHAEASNLEMVAMVGGRIIGAAKACNINAERVRKASDRMLSVVKVKAGTEAERKSAIGYFESAQVAGAEQIRSERSRCNEIHVDFSEIEIKLGRAPVAPAPDGDRVVAKRGVPPLGAIKPEASATQ